MKGVICVRYGESLHAIRGKSLCVVYWESLCIESGESDLFCTSLQLKKALLGPKRFAK